MEEIISLIYDGCKLARDLELNLPHIANQPSSLSNSCEDIIKMFMSIRERLQALEPSSASASSFAPMLLQQTQHLSRTDAGVEEWLRSSYAQATNVLQTRLVTDGSTFDARGIEIPSTQSGGREVEGSARMRGTTEELQAVDTLDSSRSSSTTTRPRRRNNDLDRQTVRVAAPRMGNTDIPPDDGFTWRKYGQKEILGSRFPRGYYRCTHQKLYQCPAKKQVQRLDDDPYTFQVTYRADHTCIMSSTAPSGAPPPPAQTTQAITLTTLQPPQTTASVTMGTWLSMGFRPSTGEAGLSPFVDSRTQMYQGGAGGSSSSSRMVGSSGAGPSTVRYGSGGREVEYQPVADMADVMFNSGSSSTNSMDFIFPSTLDDKWEPGPGGEQNK